MDCIVLLLYFVNEAVNGYRYKPRKLPNYATPRTLSQSMACFQDQWFMLKKMIESLSKLPIRHLSMSQSTGNPTSYLMHKINAFKDLWTTEWNFEILGMVSGRGCHAGTMDLHILHNAQFKQAKVSRTNLQWWSRREPFFGMLMFLGSEELSMVPWLFIQRLGYLTHSGFLIKSK